MALGYDGTVFILAFDDPASFTRLFGAADATPAQMDQLKFAKSLIWQGFKHALTIGVDRDCAGVLVDQEMGAAVALEAKELGVLVTMPDAVVDRSARFAIERSIWTDGVEAWRNGEKSREEAAVMIGEDYKRFIDNYSEAA